MKNKILTIKGLRYQSNDCNKLDDYNKDVYNILLISENQELNNEIKECLDDNDYKFIGHISRLDDSKLEDSKSNDERSDELNNKINRLNPDLVLIDTDTKGIDLIKLAESLESYNIPAVMIVGDLYDETTDKLLMRSSYGYVLKDIDEKELHRSISIAIERSKDNKREIAETEHIIQRKNRDLLIEKSESLVLLSTSIILIAFGILARNATWLQWLLLLPSSTLFAIALISLKKQDEAIPFDINPFVSIIIPAHNEERTIEKTIRSISAMDYKDENGENAFELIVVNDGSTDRTGKILSKLKKEFPNLRIITRNPPRSGKGKGFALNDGLIVSKGEIIGVFDADTQVKPNFLEILIPYLNDKNVDGVQSRVKMYNKNHNFLTRMQHAEFAGFGNTLIAKDNLSKTGFLGGNGQFVKRESIEKCGRWDGFAVTEDLNLSVKIMLNGGHIRYCKDVAIYQEAISEWKPFFRQRTRWAIGNFETLFVYLPSILKSNLSLRRKYGIIEHISFYAFNLLIFFGFIVAFVNLMAWILAYPTLINMDAPWIVGLITILAFFPSIMIALARDETSLVKYIVDIGRYWLYCFHLIPLFFKTMFTMIGRKERKWAKTEHKGQIEERFLLNEKISG